MTDRIHHIDCNYIAELKPAYLDDLLTAEEKAGFEKHLKSCSHCAAEVKATADFIAVLDEHRHVMCPESWELFDAYRDPTNISESMRLHLENCPSCRAYVRSFQIEGTETAMPGHLWDRMTASVDRVEYVEPRRVWGKIWDALADATRYVVGNPGTALAGAAAVAILVAVALHTVPDVRPTAQLSDAQWHSVMLKRKLMSPSTPMHVAGPEKKKVAELIFVERDAAGALSATIDALYAEIEPAADMRNRIDWVTPAEIKEALASKKAPKTDKQAIAEVLHSAMNVSLLVAVTLQQSDMEGRYDITAELLDAKTGVSLSRTALPGVDRNAAAAEIRTAVRAMLPAPGPDRHRTDPNRRNR